MNRCYLLFSLLLIVFPLSAIDIPFSDQAVMTDTNLIGDFVRIDPDDSQA